MYRNNPAYKLEKEVTIGEKTYSIYTPANIMEGYHKSREVEANIQLIYSNSGTTKEVLRSIAQEIVNRCNVQDLKTLKTDIAALAQNILYRTDYPVDQYCSIRMGAILSFMEIREGETIISSEEPNKCESFWLEKKVSMALDHPDLYTFFLTWGLANTPTYREALDTSIGLDYFSKREEMLRSLTPKELSSKK